MKKTIFFKLICLFAVVGVGNLTAQVDFDPDYETQKSRVSYVPGIKVIRGATRVIVPMYKTPCPNGTVFKFNNGDIQVYDRRSNDGGKTWRRVDHILEASTYQNSGKDGEVLMFESEERIYPYYQEGKYTSGRPEIRLKETNQQGVFMAKFFRSIDNGLSRIYGTAKIYLPEEWNDWSGVLNRKIIRDVKGNLLMSTYGKSEKVNGANQYSVFVIQSTDEGKTWHHLSTVAFGLTEGVRSEGFDEPTLLILPDGEILIFMRTGTSYQSSLGSHDNNDPNVEMPFSYHKSTPIYMSRSTDGGKSWSNADPVTDEFGVWPDALQLKNGLIAMSYGRPGNWLMFSKDEGESWGPKIPFYQGIYPPDCSNYFSMAEVAPNTILVVYARTDPNDHWQSEIVGTYFQVKRVNE